MGVSPFNIYMKDDSKAAPPKIPTLRSALAMTLHLGSGNGRRSERLRRSFTERWTQPFDRTRQLASALIFRRHPTRRLQGRQVAKTRCRANALRAGHRPGLRAKLFPLKGRARNRFAATPPGASPPALIQGRPRLQGDWGAISLTPAIHFLWISYNSSPRFLSIW
jgi:hypothetical protein